MISDEEKWQLNGWRAQQRPNFYAGLGIWPRFSRYEVCESKKGDLIIRPKGNAKLSFGARQNVPTFCFPKMTHRTSAWFQ